jgi:hypothetical protein
MPFHQRLIATLSSVLLLQLSLFGNDALCTAHNGHAMSGMAQHHSTHGQPSSKDCGSESDGKSHRGPLAPDGPGSCASMISCATATAAPTSGAGMTGTLPTAGELPEPLSAESDLAVAPEPPPPRL